jgi:hypothetical protein
VDVGLVVLLLQRVEAAVDLLAVDSATWVMVAAIAAKLRLYDSAKSVLMLIRPLRWYTSMSISNRSFTMDVMS